MKIGKKHIIYVGVVAAGLSWLAYDRVSSTPQGDPEAAASALLVSPSATASAAPAPPHRGAAAAASPSSRPLLVEQLDAAARSSQVDLQQTRDIFTPSQVWVPPVPKATTRPAEDLADSFIRRHRLMSVVVAGQRGGALIDGRLLRVGEDLDGFRLVSVSKQAAVLQSGNIRAELKFQAAAPEPAAAQAAASN